MREHDLTRVHLIEPGGRGGVYQHTVALANVLSERLDVTIHTARDPETPPHAAVHVCPCVEWHRCLRDSPWRDVRIASSFLTRTMTHLGRVVRQGDIAHFQGYWFAPLSLTAFVVVKSARARVVHSPHNTFPRRSGRTGVGYLRLSAHLTDAYIAFSGFDLQRLESLRTPTYRAPLVQLVPESSAEDVERARQAFQGAEAKRVLLFAGQLRPDKRLDLVIRAASLLGPRYRVVVLGEDLGSVHSNRELADELAVDVDWRVGWVPLEEFVTAIRAADVVVCPYDVASQSGVLAIAAAVGTPSVATAVGGLDDIAARTVSVGDATALASAVLSLDSDSADRSLGCWPQDVLGAHLAAYGLEEAACG